jgi:hypothetical protein
MSSPTRRSDQKRGRRDLSTGQKALAYALLFPKADQQGRRTDLNLSTNGQVDLPRQRISDARAILEFAPGDIEAVKSGDEPFTFIGAGERWSRKETCRNRHVS